MGGLFGLLQVFVLRLFVRRVCQGFVVMCVGVRRVHRMVVARLHSVATPAWPLTGICARLACRFACGFGMMSRLIVIGFRGRWLWDSLVAFLHGVRLGCLCLLVFVGCMLAFPCLSFCCCHLVAGLFNMIFMDFVGG